MALPKIIFTPHSLQRLQERYPFMSRYQVYKALTNPAEWLDRPENDEQSGGNKGDGRKVKIRLKIDGIRCTAIAILKVEGGRNTMVIPSVHPTAPQ